jgi:4-oxalocrotonate tautomerase
MPVVIVKLGKERTIQQKQKLVKAITEDVVNILEVKPEWVYVLIEELGQENWSSAGELHSDKFAVKPTRKIRGKKTK